MSIARTWVFPILRILVFAVIAAALVKVAFFADSTEPAVDPDVPSAVIVEPEYEVALGTITNDVTLTGTVLAKPAVAVPATAVGEVTAVWEKEGANLDKGDPVLTLTSESVDDDGDVAKKSVVVTAPADGVLSSLVALPGQSFAIGDSVGQIAPPTFVVTGSLAPDQLYRLVDDPSSAEVAITNGPAPFTCRHLEITSPLEGAVDGSGDTATSGPTVTCSVPSKVRVFPGLAAKITIAGGSADGVLVVPTTAVEGATGTGSVYLVSADGTNEKHEVTVGLNDGKNVEITAGLEAGDRILQFIPGVAAVTPDGCVSYADGTEACG